MLNTVGRFIYTKYRGIMYVWALWEDLFTHNTEEYFMLNTVGRFIYTKYWGILYVKPWEDLFTQNTEEYFMVSTGNIYLHKILRNTLC
jgi:hypothetical protein